jgi:hypothetical protein
VLATVDLPFDAGAPVVLDETVYVPPKPSTSTTARESR